MAPSKSPAYGPEGVLLIRSVIAVTKSIPSTSIFLVMNFASFIISSSESSAANVLKIASNVSPLVARVAIYPRK